MWQFLLRLDEAAADLDDILRGLLLIVIDLSRDRIDRAQRGLSNIHRSRGIGRCRHHVPNTEFCHAQSLPSRYSATNRR